VCDQEGSQEAGYEEDCQAEIEEEIGLLDVPLWDVKYI